MNNSVEVKNDQYTYKVNIITVQLSKSCKKEKHWSDWLELDLNIREEVGMA